MRETVSRHRACLLYTSVVQVAVDDDSDGDAAGEVQVNDVLFGTRASFRIFAVAADVYKRQG